MQRTAQRRIKILGLSAIASVAQEMLSKTKLIENGSTAKGQNVSANISTSNRVGLLLGQQYIAR